MPSHSVPPTPSRPVAWVIGASSGVGAATAGELVRRGYDVALSGRREENLARLTESLSVDTPGTRVGAYPLDVNDPAETSATHARLIADLGPVSCLVYAAGLNTPRRYLRDMLPSETQEIFATNAISPTHVTQLVLPGMRAAERGLIVFISSIAAWRHSPDAGVAYSASKKAMSVLAEHVNSTEGAHGIKATAVCPGDIDTEFLAMRPHVPDAPARREMLTAQDVGLAVGLVLDLPGNVCVDELVITPVKRGNG